MDAGTAVGGGFAMVLAWVLLTWMRQAWLNIQLNRLLKASDPLNRTQSRRSAKNLGIDTTIGDIIRDLPPVDPKGDTC